MADKRQPEPSSDLTHIVNLTERQQEKVCQHCGKLVVPRPEDFKGLPDQDYCPACGGVIMTYYNKHKLRPFFCYPPEEWAKIPPLLQKVSKIKPWMPSIYVLFCLIVIFAFMIYYY